MSRETHTVVADEVTDEALVALFGGVTPNYTTILSPTLRHRLPATLDLSSI